MSLEVDSNGLVTQYGPRITTDGLGGVQTTLGDTVRLVYDFDVSHYPPTGALEASAATAPTNPGSGNNMIPIIPASAYILRASLEIITAFAGGTSIAVTPVSAVDGSTVITAGGFITATQGALANLTPAGTIIIGTGASVSAQVNLGGADAEVKVVVVGTMTAGRAKIVIEYLMPSYSMDV